MRRALAVAAGLLVVALGLPNLIVWHGGREPVTSDAARVPHAQAALVLGAQVKPDGTPSALRYYDELRERGDVAFRVSPYGGERDSVPFSFDYSFNYYPLSYERPGPEIVIYRLRECPA